MLKTFVIAAPWDLADAPDRHLDFMHGEIGVSGLLLWVVVPEVHVVRAGEVHPRILRDSGGLLVQPEGVALRGTSWRPILADWTRTHAGVAAIVAACDRRGLELRFALTLGAGGRIARDHPETACVNALDAASQYTACLSHPEAESYARAVLDEVSRRCGRRTCVLFDLFPAWTDHRRGAWSLPGCCGDMEQSALSICFCDACCRISAAGGVDVTAARRQAAALIDGAAAGLSPPRRFTAALADAPALTAHLRAQWNERAALLARWSETRADLRVHRRAAGTALDAAMPPDFAGIPAGLVSQVDAPDELAVAAVESAKQSELLLGPALFRALDDPGLVHFLQEAAHRLGDGVYLGDYGTVPVSRWTALRQAVRYARRTRGE